MIYQQVIALLKTYPNSKDAIMYASTNAFNLVELHDAGYSIQQLVQVCLNNK